MGEHDDEELQRAFRMSLQPAPEAKRSKPREVAGTQSPSSITATTMPQSTESPEGMERRLQRELRAAAAERRRLSALGGRLASSSGSPEEMDADVAVLPALPVTADGDFEDRSAVKGSAHLQDRVKANSGDKSLRGKRRVEDERQQLPYRIAEQLHNMVFGTEVSREVLAQWCKQGFRFSADPETSLGLVQHEGGPCGVLAPIQALVLKYLLFVMDDEKDTIHGICKKENNQLPLNYLSGDKQPIDSTLVFSDAQRTRALVCAMGETLWRAGSKKRAVVAVVDIPGFRSEYSIREDEQDEALAMALDGVALESPSEVQKNIRVCTVSSLSALHQQLQNFLPIFRSRMGALLLLFSALLSRDLDAVQSDRDDLEPQPLVAPPFGHAAQEIVNLLLCGQAVPHVFDGSIDLEGGMHLKGIPSNVEVGFLTIMEAVNLCKVGQHLKCPKWPIWVVGSESHYTVLFAFSTSVQDEPELEDREAVVRQAFDTHDQSGGGGFITPEALQQVITDLKIDMPQDMLTNLCNSDIVVWNDLWQALCQIEKSKGGLKEAPAALEKREFELYHFNGIAKTVSNSMFGAGDATQSRPRLTKLRVVVPPKWTPDTVLVEEYKGGNAGTGKGDQEQSSVLETVEAPSQHAPLVDCVRTRWQRATCNWSGDAPSIV